MATVALRGVSKSFTGDAGKPVAAVKRVDLEVSDGEFVVLVGPSGCGKTTTLRMIAGLEDPTEGEIEIGSRVVNRVAPKDRNIAMVFQNYALYPHMTVYRNMAFGLELRYRSDWWSRAYLAVTRPKQAKEFAQLRSGIRSRVEQTAELLGIGHLLDRKPGQLSGGEKQRVALGRAIVRQPAAFLFDEPLSNLDAQLRGEMRRELRRLHADLKATMIYVTHDQVEAMTLGDRIVVMHQGEVRQVGTPLEVYDQPADRFVAQFIGSPPMNLFAGESQQQDGQLRFIGRGLSLPVPSTFGFESRKPLLLGVRPEDVHLSRDGGGDIETTVEAVELLGDATIVHLLAGPQRERLTAKLRERSNLGEGDRVSLRFDSRRLHWFDGESGKRLGG